jgi:hypothetical protein
MTAFRTSPKTAKKLPREGTRVAAVIKAWQANPTASHWSDLKRAYDNASPALNSFSRNYTGMELSRITKRYGRRVSRGIYRLDERWWNPIKVPVKESGIGYEVGDLVEITEPNSDMECVGLRKGDTARIAWIESIRDAKASGSPEARLVKIHSYPGMYFHWRFKKYDTKPKYPEYLDELEDLVIGTRLIVTDTSNVTISKIAEALEEILVGVDQTLTVIRAAKENKW